MRCTFKDEKGYVEGLNENIIDNYVNWVKAHIAKDRDLTNVDAKLRYEFSSTVRLY